MPVTESVEEMVQALGQVFHARTLGQVTPELCQFLVEVEAGKREVREAAAERPAEVVNSHGTIAACDKRPLHHVVLFWVLNLGLGEVEQSERRTAALPGVVVSRPLCRGGR